MACVASVRRVAALATIIAVVTVVVPLVRKDGVLSLWKAVAEEKSDYRFHTPKVVFDDASVSLASRLMKGEVRLRDVMPRLPTQRWSVPPSIQAAYDSVRASLYEGGLPSRKNITVPVIGFIVTDSDFIFLIQSLAAIDTGVGKYVFVINGPQRRYHDFLLALEHLFPESVHVIKNFRNVGVATSWNAMARIAFDPTSAGSVREPKKATSAAAFVLISNADILTFPLCLADFSVKTHMSSTTMLLHRFYAHACFAVTYFAIRELGYFDETIFPAYGEDIEYELRMTSKFEFTLQNYGNYGAPFVLNQFVFAANHFGSPTVKARGPANSVIERFPRMEYLTQKWNYKGGGIDRKTTFRHPFNNTKIHTNNSWIVDPHQRACLLGLREPAADGQCHFNMKVLSALEVETQL